MDVDQARQSVRKIASLEFDLMLSGHGVPLRTGASGRVREFAKTYGALPVYKGKTAVSLPYTQLPAKVTSRQPM